MLVFIDVPLTTKAPHRGFRHVLGRGELAWMGLDFDRKDLADPERFSRYKVVGGMFTMAEVRHFPKTATICAVVQEPSKRVAAHWSAVANDPRHRLHSVAHTFLLREVFEEQHPFVGGLVNVMTRFLSPGGGRPPTAAAVFEEFDGRPSLIGDSVNAVPLTARLARLLRIPQERFDPTAFEAPEGERLRRDVLALIRGNNRQDEALYREVSQRRKRAREEAERAQAKRKETRAKKAQSDHGAAHTDGIKDRAASGVETPKEQRPDVGTNGAREAGPQGPKPENDAGKARVKNTTSGTG